MKSDLPRWLAPVVTPVLAFLAVVAPVLKVLDYLNPKNALGLAIAATLIMGAWLFHVWTARLQPAIHGSTVRGFRFSGWVRYGSAGALLAGLCATAFLSFSAFTADGRRDALFADVKANPSRWKSVLTSSFETGKLRFTDVTAVFAKELSDLINKTESKPDSLLSQVNVSDVYGLLLKRTREPHDLLWLVEEGLRNYGSTKVAFNSLAAAGRSNPIFENQQLWLAVLDRIPTPISQMNTGILPHVLARVSTSHPKVRAFLRKAYLPVNKPPPDAVGWSEYSGNQDMIVKSILDDLGVEQFVAEFLQKCQFVRMRLIAFQVLLGSREYRDQMRRRSLIAALAETIELYAYWDGWIGEWGEESTINYFVSEIKFGLSPEDLEVLRGNIRTKRNSTYLLEALENRVKTAKDDPGKALTRAIRHLHGGIE